MMDDEGKFRIAIIGHSQFAAKVYRAIKQDGYEITGVFTIPDNNCREDPLAKAAASDEIPVFKIKKWRSEGKPLAEVLEQYKSIEVDLNVMAFCTQLIPKEVIDRPRCKSICYHPSILPRHRGANSISWTLIEGDETAGLTVFWADDQFDTGPILLQRECEVDPNDTLDSLYKRFMYPEGIKAMAEAVNLVAEGIAPRIPQSNEAATYDAMLNKKELQRIDWKNKNAKQVHDFIRALDSTPGAWTLIGEEEVRFYGSSLWNVDETPVGDEVDVDGQLGVVNDEGLLIRAEGGWVMVQFIRIANKTINASQFGIVQNDLVEIELNEDEQIVVNKIKSIWQDILNYEVDDDTDFFDCGASSMEVLLLIEELEDQLKIQLRNIDVFMAPVFLKFATKAILARRSDQEFSDESL